MPSHDPPPDPDTFHFRRLHPLLRLGTASDRYAAWIGQIYSSARFAGRITTRSKTVGKRTFTEQVLPVESVEEYFEHFDILELDFTFYRPLLREDGSPTPNFHALRTYREHLGPRDRLLLKVPQGVCARKLWRAGAWVDNPRHLDATAFLRQFYEPAVQLLGSALAGLIFEQEYHRKSERRDASQVAADYDRFFGSVPGDDRYHLELRTAAYLSPALFQVLQHHGVGQVLSHWTWLPPLPEQLRRASGRFLNRGGETVLRLLTPRNVRYEQAYAMAHPFQRPVEGMLDPELVEDAVRILELAVDRRVRANVIVNNRAGGNAPWIARRIAERVRAVFADRPGNPDHPPGP